MALRTLKPRISSQPKRINGETYRRSGSWLVKERKVLFNDHPLCVLCLAKTPEILRVAVHRDHIVPLWQGGQDTRENTQAICEFCHAEKSALEAKERWGGSA